MKNKRALLTGLRKIEIIEEDINYKKSSGKLLVSMTSVGICGSDMHYFDHGGLGSHKQNLPMQMGHEPAGIIYDAPSCSKFKPGDRVAIEPGFSCFHCGYCHSGKHNLCDHVEFMGANDYGAFSNYNILDESQCFKIQDHVSDDTIALLETMGIAMHTFNVSKFENNSNILIIGAGPIGLCHAIHGKLLGHNISLLELEDYRINHATSIGFNASSSFDETKFDNVIDCAGNQESLRDSILLTKKSGCVSIVGIPCEDYLQINPHKMRTKELRLQNVRRSNQTLLKCIDLYNNVDLDNMLVTHRYSLENIQSAFELVSEKKEKVIKCIVTCEA